MFGCMSGTDSLRAPGAGTETIGVVFVREATAIGDELESADLEVREYPVSLVPEGVFLSTEQVVGRRARLPMGAGQMVRAPYLADPEGGFGVQALIPLGMRATPYSPQDDIPIHGGEYVDLWWDPGTGYCCGMQAVFVLAPMTAFPAHHGVYSDLMLTTDQGTVMVLEMSTHASFRRSLRNGLDVGYAKGVSCP